MAFNNDPFFYSALKTAVQTIVNADGTTLKTVYTAGANGGKVVGIGQTTDDTATEDCQLWLTVGAVTVLLGTKTIPITAGFVTGTPAFNWFDGIQMPFVPIDRDGQRYLPIPPAGVLKWGSKVAVTAAKTHYLTCLCYDY